MGFAPVPSHTQIQTALRSALVQIMPFGMLIVQGQDNDVAQPKGDFIVMTVIRRERISTNIDTYQDCKFTGSVNGTIVTVGPIAFGTPTVGNLLFGTGAAQNPVIMAVNANGTLTLSAPATTATRTLSCGVKSIQQSTRVVFQLDIHSPDMGRASDYAQAISTVMRDDTGAMLLQASGLPVTPLYADDPKQIPFMNKESQFENRYVVECHLQADQVITPPQEFADRVDVDRLPVDLFYVA